MIDKERRAAVVLGSDSNGHVGRNRGGVQEGSAVGDKGAEKENSYLPEPI